MENKSGFVCQIGMVAPSGFGKTSLIASVFRKGPICPGVSIVINDKPTAKRLAILDECLERAGRGAMAPVGAVEPTPRHCIYGVKIDAGGRGEGIPVAWLDYAGDSIDPYRTVTPGTDRDYDIWWNWIRDSNVLMIPIDAGYIMEAKTERQQAYVARIVRASGVVKVAKEWAEERRRFAPDPALMLLCPVQCETYFADNGGTQDRSSELVDAVAKYYGGVIDVVLSVAPFATICYAPVDTMGSVAIVDSHWEDVPGSNTQLACCCHFGIRPVRGERAKGADDVLAMISLYAAQAKRAWYAASGRSALGDAAVQRLDSVIAKISLRRTGSRPPSPR